ncbi:Na+/H+ antiporter NhaC [Pseudomaricurvus alkylphenolicus]|uniref:Na+/H+ antiporter NhaC n=1 Tax=Pseudomaricurvus alkylphenolicus TaxID=1306991 RepID=UPI001421639D|nr:Na+/H+ antiporter NhaC [Pseudomaricurvus alkylphenolicus]NIB38574.1 Na+/H+ antiporter NhaC [Pseudomaricurvus alkylphenolicus]
MTYTASDKRVGFWSSLSVMLFLVVAISTQVFVLKSTGTTQITLIMVTAVAALVALLHGFSWEEVQEGILYGCNLAMLPMLILMLVGVLIASWIAAGTIPALIYYGMMALTPEYFLFTACLICCLGSVCTGSSWTTAATFGVGFMGVGLGLGIPPALTAGAVISGSIFGDKMSPLSDSTNLASGVAEADLFDHIRSMAYSTGPAILLTLAIFFLFGVSSESGGSNNNDRMDSLIEGIRNNYVLNPLTLLPPVLVVLLAVKKVGGLAVMVIATLLGFVLAVVVQGHSVSDMLHYMNYGFVSEIGIPEVDKLLSGGGLQNMMWTISLAFAALAMGGVMEKTKMLTVILEQVQKMVNSVSGLVTTHVVSSVVINVFTASQYMAIIIPTRMLIPLYKKKRLLPQVCSRVSEDSATVTSPLIPWGLGGVYYASVLGVATLDYLPYTFFAWLAPIITLLLAYTNKYMFREGDISSRQVYRDAENIRV